MLEKLTEAEEERIHTHGVHAEESVSDEVGAHDQRLRKDPNQLIQRDTMTPNAQQSNKCTETEWRHVNSSDLAGPSGFMITA